MNAEVKIQGIPRPFWLTLYLISGLKSEMTPWMNLIHQLKKGSQ